MRNAELEHTVSYWTAQANMRIIELENCCRVTVTVGSNPTLSAQTRCCIRDCWWFQMPCYTLRYTCTAA